MQHVVNLELPVFNLELKEEFRHQSSEGEYTPAVQPGVGRDNGVNSPSSIPRWDKAQRLLS